MEHWKAFPGGLKMATASKVLSMSFTACVVSGCGAGSIAPPDNGFALYETSYQGTVPVEGSVTYENGAEAALCAPPSWSELHPQESELTWPTIRVGALGDLGSVHPDAPELNGPVFVAFPSPSLIENDGGTFAVTTWSGAAVQCREETLEAGDVVIVGGLFSEPASAATFEQLSDFVVEGAPTPWGDLDVAVSRE